MTDPIGNDEDDKNLMYGLELEWQWRDTQEQPNDQELLKIFPDAKEIIPSKIKELAVTERQMKEKIKHDLSQIRASVSPDSQWFHKEMIKHFQVARLVKVQRKIRHLYRLLNLAYPRRRIHADRGGIDGTQISRARQASIIDIVGQYTKLRKCGKNWTGLCPLHREKHPSFVVYPASNTWHCFGCGAGSSSIDLIIKLNGLSFKEAVQLLTK